MEPQRFVWLHSLATALRNIFYGANKTASNKQSSQTQTHFRFFDLPAEIRNLIYEEYFFNSHHYICSRRPTSKTPALLLASKTNYIEALPIYYSKTTFVIWLTEANEMAKWFVHKPEKLREAIPSIRADPGIYLRDYSWDEAKYLKYFEDVVIDAGGEIGEGVLQVGVYGC